MKRVCKGPIPQALNSYKSIAPNATWDEMRGDNYRGGHQAYHECRDQVISDQEGLCAYCERKISTNAPIQCRVEHFHPKSDKTGNHNWALDLFALEKDTGHLKPDEASCDTIKVTGNAYETTAELVNRTIAALNLNCDRLSGKRRLLVKNIDHNKMTLRKKGIPQAEMNAKLAQR
jgi:5-methylcytosine-specific restriction endonuclease McrA